jgi:hypothetical protein
MEAARTSETSVDIQLRTRQYIPEDSEFQYQHVRRLKNWSNTEVICNRMRKVCILYWKGWIRAIVVYLTVHQANSPVLTEAKNTLCYVYEVKPSRYSHRGDKAERYISLLIVYFGSKWGWMVSVMPRPRFSPGERTPLHPLDRRLGGPQNCCWLAVFSQRSLFKTTVALH